MASEGTEPGRSFYPSLSIGNTFTFKFEYRKGRVHRLNCGSENLSELVNAVMQRMGNDNDQDHLPQPHFLYEDDEGDKVLLATDSDLVGAVIHARLARRKMTIKR